MLIERSPVGKSSSSGSVENGIQQVLAQIRAIKLDLKASLDVPRTSQHPHWPWSVEVVAQILALYLVNRFAGLRAMRRIRGRASMSPKARFGERELYKQLNISNLENTEARWKYGAWPGTIEQTDEQVKIHERTDCGNSSQC